MSSKGITSSSEYFIDTISIQSKVNGDFFELVNIFNTIEIFESMTHTFIHGRIYITDTNGLIENLPIIGQEQIRFKIKKVETDSKYFEVIGHVYKISNRTRDSSRKGVESYIIEFITENSILNQVQRVSKTYEGEVSKAVEDISQNFLGLSKNSNPKPNVERNPELYKDIYIENTKEKNKITVPNMKPVEAINFLTKFSFSQGSGKNKNPYNTSYKFYQTRQGYFYQSIENAISQNKKVEKAFLISNDPNIKNDNKILSKDDLFSVIEYSFLNFYDIFSSSDDGYYGGRNLGYDTITKSIHKYDLKYIDKFDDMTHLDQNDTNTSEFILNKVPEKSYIVSLPTKKGSNGSEYIKNKSKNKDIFYCKEDEIDILKKVKNERFNEGIVVEMTIPSNPFLYVNEVVYLHFPSFKREDNGKKEYFDDKYFSGNYLVVSIDHILTNIDDNTWFMKVTLLKDSYKSEIE